MIIKRLLIGTASALAIVSAAHAQTSSPGETAQSPTQTVTPDDNEAIIVTGFRRSIRDALNIKRNSDVIADIISAEDIGKFPDKNVAEALQRVPGITINRDFGEGERVSLRGTAPNLTRTLVNGHAIATADWFVLEQLSATRSFNYLTLPADIVGQIDVYKSPEADIDEGGLGGTINVHVADARDGDEDVEARCKVRLAGQAGFQLGVDRRSGDRSGRL